MTVGTRLAGVVLLALVACGGGSLDAGADVHKVLPIDGRNPVLLCNDGAYDNWQGEYAALMASSGILSLAGIIINTSPVWTGLSDNMAGWRQMVVAARQSGLRNIPDPIGSTGAMLVRPSDGKIDSTVPNRSEGATLIVKESKSLSHPYRPLVVVTGARLTDVADAYLMDPTVADRIVVLAWLGTTTKDGSEMGRPNGEMDTWADVIVAQRLNYIQISLPYDQMTDVSTTLLSQLPVNAFTTWMRSKQPQIVNNPQAADHVAIAAVGIPSLVATVSKVAQQGTDSNNLPTLSTDDSGRVLLVSQITGALVAARFWEMLFAPGTFTAH